MAIVNDYYEEPYAGKSHVRFCEGHKFSLSHNKINIKEIGGMEYVYSTKINFKWQTRQDKTRQDKTRQDKTRQGCVM